MSITPNMNLTLPTVLTTPGPDYANEVNNDLSVIDGHDHSPGNGVQITPSGLNINSDLPFTNNANINSIRSVRFQQQSGTLSGPLDFRNLYVVSADLWYNDGSGTPIRITQSGAVAGTPGSISGLVSPASASYNGISDTFVWQSNANTPANMDAASYIFRNLVANSKGLTLSAPAGMAADYSLVLPTLPAQTGFMRLDSSGNMTANVVVDNSTIDILAGSPNQLEVKALGITGAQIANGTITPNKLASGSLQTHQVFTSNGTFTVPAGINILTWTYVGAGGGGGGGGGPFENGSSQFISGGGGGGGGVAGQVLSTTVPTTPSTVWTVTVGAGGTAGSGGGTNVNGSAGGTGGISTVTDGSTFLVAAGGNPGAPGLVFSSGPLQTGGNSGSIFQYNSGFIFSTGGTSNGTSATPGGNAPDGGTFGDAGAGGAAGDTVAGASGGSSLVSGGAGGAAGARSGGGGGGAGGSLFSDAAGGTGGAGSAGGGTAIAGGNGAGHGSGGGGGGGGGAALSSGSNGANGGAGSGGIVIVFYQAST